MTVVGTVLGMLLASHGPVGGLLYPPHPGPQPVGFQAPVLAAAIVAQAVGFGLALAILSESRHLLATLARAVGGRVGVARAALGSLAWILGSWIPHVSLHLHIDPADLWALAAIEWGFHVTIVLAGAALLRYVRLAAARDGTPSTREGARAGAPQEA